MAALGVLIFGSVRFLSKKVTKLNFFSKKTKTEPKLVQTDRFWFSSVRFFREKTCSNRFGSVFPVWLGFLQVWLGFFLFFSVSVRFSFFGFRLIKPKLNQTSPFFLNFNWFNRFFSQFGFFDYFFSGFLGFFLTPRQHGWILHTNNYFLIIFFSY